MTNTHIQQFDFNNQQVRVITDKQGEPWFVGKDVADILGYANASKALQDHVDPEDKLNNETLSSLGQRGGWLINESGLYSLVLSSKLPSARAFKRWVTSEVLPSIRKHGGYMSGQEQLSPEELVLKSMQYLQSKIDEQRAQLKAQESKVMFANAYNASEKSILVGELAKILNQNGYKTGQQRLFKQLREEGYLMKKNSNPNFPTQRSMDLKLFEVKASTITKPDGKEISKFTTKVTPKGQEYFINKYLHATPFQLEA